jgi:hypothetical protein
MEDLLEAVLEIFAEYFFQVVFEILAESGVRSIGEVFQRRPKPWVAALGYIFLGLIAGWISVWLVPALLTSHVLRIANVLLTPILCGLTMSLIGAWRDLRGQERIRLDRFAYGYVFALSVALVRFVMAT